MKVSRNGADGSIKIIHDSVENVDISDATAIFLYLVPEGMKAIQDKLRAAVLERGVRVVAHVFSVPGLVPTEVSLVCVYVCVSVTCGILSVLHSVRLFCRLYYTRIL